MSGPAATARTDASGGDVFVARGLSTLRRLDTLALRLFVLMWATLVFSHLVAYLTVTRLPWPQAPLSASRSERPPPPGRGEAEPATRRPPPSPAGAGRAPAGPDGAERPPMMRAPADEGPGGGPRPGPPPRPGDGPPPVTLGSLPPTPGVPSVGAGPGPAPHLPAPALALDYGVRVLVIALAAWWGSRWVARPMARLAGAAQTLGGALARGQRPLPLPEDAGTREVRATASVFNRMAAQIGRLFESRNLVMASISHDLRTPLTRMRMRVETAELPPPLRERCVADLAEMNALIDSLLDFFRLGAGAASTLLRLDAAALLQALVDDHVEQGHAVRATLPDAPLVLRTDALALRRIVDNLVVNALRYAGSAEVTLEATGSGVQIHVLDRGPGIPPEQLENVLHPFVRLEASRNRATGGAGLGLAIANELAQALGGTLALSNRPGGGLSARLLLPDTR